MSHSPSDSTSKTAREQYTRHWNGLVQLLRQGRSFSGRERNCCFLNTGQTRFADISAVSGLDFPEDGRAVLPIDWDFDGDLDLWLIGRTAPRVRLMENRLAQQGHFLAIRLEGRDANRDAIGARVELYRKGQPDQPLIETVRAGEGFESQGSQWLHFGLGDAADIDRVVVRWPGGDVQTLSGFAPDRWYDIVQGQQQPTPWTPPSANRRFPTPPALAETESRSTSPSEEPTGQKPEETGSHSREAPSEAQRDLPDDTRPIVLADPIPMPRLWYKTGTDATKTLDYQKGEATLINLWATWCVPCAKELREFGAAAQMLRSHNLRIVALNVDGLRDSGRGSPGEADAMLDRLGFVSEQGPSEQGPSEQGPYERGWATDALMTKLQLLQAPLVESGPSLVVPTSFLITGDGSLVAVYRGPVQVEQLLKDLEPHLGQPVDGQRAVGMFPGRWLQRPSYWELIARLGDAFRNTQMLPEAFLYYNRAYQLRPEHPYVRRQFEQVREQLQAVRRMQRKCQEIVRVDPNHANALARLGIAYQALGDYQQAVRYLTRSVEIAGDDSQTRTALGVSLAYLGEREQAQRQFQRAIALDPSNQQAQRNLKRFAGKGKED